MATTAPAPTGELCDTDIVRYWSIFADDHLAEAYAIVSTPAASFELVRRSVDTLAHHPLMGAAATRRMLRIAPIDDATFNDALDAEEDWPRIYALANMHRGPQIQHMWGELAPMERSGALFTNEGLDPDFIDTRFRELGEPAGVAKNSATPTRTLVRVLNLSPTLAHRVTVLSHPNAPRERVLEALDRDATLARAAINWPGLTIDDLTRVIERAKDDTLWVVARQHLEDRTATPGERKVAALSKRLRRDVALHLRDHLPEGDATAAASRIARAGFTGTVDELIAVAETFT